MLSCRLEWCRLLPSFSSRSLSGQEARPTGKATPASAAADVLAFEREMEAAVDAASVALSRSRHCERFHVHPRRRVDDRRRPLKVDDRASWLAAVAKAPYLRREL